MFPLYLDIYVIVEISDAEVLCVHCMSVYAVALLRSEADHRVLSCIFLQLPAQRCRSMVIHSCEEQVVVWYSCINCHLTSLYSLFTINTCNLLWCLFGFSCTIRRPHRYGEPFGLNAYLSTSYGLAWSFTPPQSGACFYFEVGLMAHTQIGGLPGFLISEPAERYH